MRWRWVEGSRWRVDGVPDEAVVEGEGDKWDYDGVGGKNGWVYYDNKVCFSPLKFLKVLRLTICPCSGSTVAAVQMAGDDGPGDESGTVMPSWSRSIATTNKLRLRQRPQTVRQICQIHLHCLKRRRLAPNARHPSHHDQRCPPSHHHSQPQATRYPGPTQQPFKRLKRKTLIPRTRKPMTSPRY